MYFSVLFLLQKTSTKYLCVVCVGENLGIASAGAAGLKGLVHVLQATMRACPFWDFAIPFSRNGSTVCMYVCMVTEGSARPAVVPSTYLRVTKATSVSGGQNRQVNCSTTRARNNIARQVIVPASVRSNHFCKDLTAGRVRFRNRNNEIARA